jgi:ferrous iron transport protein B
VILGINILLWFLASYPRHGEVTRGGELDAAQAGARLRGSFAGQAGRLLEPVIAPLGFDWKMGIGIVSSFAAREVFVSTMSIVYNVAEGPTKTRTPADWPKSCASSKGRTASPSIRR